MDSVILQDMEEIYSRDIDWSSLRNKTVLITGPNGMLASYVMYMLIYLNEEKNMGIHIIAMARSRERFEKKFGDYSKKSYIELVTDPITEPIHINGSVDYIIHAASLASPQYYDTCPVEVLSPNILGTYYLLQLAVEKQTKGFILFSSGDVYGKVTDVDSITEQDMGRLDPLDIHSCYGESKRMAETICYSFMHQYGVPMEILRIFHTYAPTMEIQKDPRVFASFVNNIVNGEDIVIKSDGTGKRAFCYAADATAALFIVMFRGQSGEAYNLCNTDQFVSIRQLAETLVTLRHDADIKIIWRQRSAGEHYTENKTAGEVAPSNEKLKKLGWEARYDIRKGFERVLDYQMKKHVSECD